VPVVEIDGTIRFRGRVDPMLLQRLLAVAATPLRSQKTQRDNDVKNAREQTT